MGVIGTLVRWYALRCGRGRRMRARGAEVMACPHCDRDTPVYRSDYDAAGDPVSFSVCLWCGGVIEYGGAPAGPHAPYADADGARERAPGRSR